MKRLLQITLGILTSIGGFLDVGAIATSAQAGAEYRFKLLWAVALGTLCVIFLVEMAGRLAAASQHTIVDAMRAKLGFKFYVWPLAAELVVDFLTLAAEIGGVSVALQLVTGIKAAVWAMPVAFCVWLLLWKGTFGLIENGVSLLGLVTLVFVYAALRLHPHWGEVGRGLLPTLPHDKPFRYLFIVVGIIGAIISPYLLYFYSSGAVEEKWDKSYLGANKVTATLGMGFGSLISIGVLTVAALVLNPQHVQIDHYPQAAAMLTPVLGHWGVLAFAAALGIACFGAALEVSSEVSYTAAQAFGWRWGVSAPPRENARFSLVYTLYLLAAGLMMTTGIDPLQLTIYTLALTTLLLPVVIGPFLLLMNDPQYVGKNRNGWVSNTVVILTLLVACLLALAAIPLQILGGGG